MNNPQYLWLPSPREVTLSPNEVHVWCINLDKSVEELQYLATILSSDEFARAERFYFPEHRQRFIAGRGSLRTILSCYLGISPQEVQFDYEPRGKPLLASKFSYSGLTFNLSHSQNLALCAVSQNRQIGIDLEYIRPMSDLESLAQRFFLPGEYDLVRSLSPEQQSSVFFRYWTCKEAYLKATGEGIAQLEQIEISLTPTASAKLQTVTGWSLLEIPAADNYAAAVVVAGVGWDLKCWQYREVKD
ncbi:MULTISPECIES: 4'-phosphopantetheinyl transferase HetI [unclassified Tolypothrix]|uniref:4'-phosphopantetheinyl transferase HetI n=1 Tax=unclassified Tolypothrix TaxID=2649714 RepID=UPI0005EAC5C4|nr:MULTISPECIES: 4'-phosphopantetheinyl transferase HetI [unclassified Tolypothrix]BAY94809.1 4'-phosphopantetheinyl transferase [Microchaete diplosiphon NIES-3275]EKE98943.1 phosphopantetheine--protein transferase domain protein [Tolypothrix sp. PCC 7601]MBE9081311.1 4'-phosphopantetheinyl transferase superfamily protein [Tolypothrix sp. LEGE 11397]UYD28464.1 4'-phosphopantetheinyl transferase superfamily protein [Tolypothrix sp. PCC 7712]UYD35626.1 4'-phosphopantetheinyl transferase superfam